MLRYFLRQTLILAGHETTATALTWTLWTLARFPEVQAKLRRELREARSKATEEGQKEIESEEFAHVVYLFSAH